MLQFLRRIAYLLRRRWLEAELLKEMDLKLVQGYLVRTPPRDPLTLACICLLLASVALIAALLPSCRAARVEPVVAFRCE
jgi:hypothetical protein